MIWFLYMEFTLLTLGAFLQTAAIVLSYRNRNKRRNKHQTYIILSLCLTELNGTLAIIIKSIPYTEVAPLKEHILWFYVHLFVRLTYHYTMVLLAIDRFLVFHLNMRYLILWPSGRLLKSLKVVYPISFLSYVSIVCLFFLKSIDWDYISNIMFTVYFIWDVIYIIQVIATYCYIFIKYKNHKELFKGYKSQPNNRDQLTLLIPTFLITTYIIFFCIPDFVTGLFQFGNANFNILHFRIVAIFYKISWLADPIVFIYDCKLLRKPKTYPHFKSHEMRNNKTSRFWRFYSLFLAWFKLL